MLASELAYVTWQGTCSAASHPFCSLHCVAASLVHLIPSLPTQQDDDDDVLQVAEYSLLQSSLGGGRFAPGPVLLGGSATYCATVVGEYVYGVCYQQGTGEDEAMLGALTVFRVKRTLGWLAHTLCLVFMYMRLALLDCKGAVACPSCCTATRKRIKHSPYVPIIILTAY